MDLQAIQRLSLQIVKVETSEAHRKQDYFIPPTTGMCVCVCVFSSSQLAVLR